MKYPMNDRWALMRPPEGPFSVFVRPFSDWVSGQGYRLAPLRERVRMAADLSRWLGKRGVPVPGVQAQHFAQYLQYRRRRRRRVRGDTVMLDQFRDYLCEQCVIAPEKIIPGTVRKSTESGVNLRLTRAPLSLYRAHPRRGRSPSSPKGCWDIRGLTTDRFPQPALSGRHHTNISDPAVARSSLGRS